MPRRSASLVALLLALLTLLPGPVSGAPAANDPVFTQGLQWGLERTNAPLAWSRATGKGVTIAVVDSGVDLRHEDLRAKIDGHVSCIGSDGDETACSGSGQDDDGHGTHVAGIALASTNNGRGIAGVAPDARLLAVRVLEHACDLEGCTAIGNDADVAAGIRWAVDHGADIVNLSLGGGEVQTALGCTYCDAVTYAWEHDVIVVVAAGNDTYFAGFDNEPAVVVTATNRADQAATYSNASSDVLRQARWPVAAPGGEAETDPSACSTGGTPQGILSTFWQPGQANEYACMAGTSMAAPHVAGALALLRSAGYAPQAAIDRLLGTAEDLGPAGRDASYGFGLINLAAALGTTGQPSTTTTQRPLPTSSPTTTAPSVVPRSATPGITATTVPPLANPGAPKYAEPFRPAIPPGGLDGDETVPGGLVAAAVASLLGSGAFVGMAAWRLRPGGTGLSR